jgi:hypothetical protein
LVLVAGRREWLSITPEPERELPGAIATIRAGRRPSPAAVERERRLAERLVLRGSRRRWLRWLRESRRLALQATAPAAEADEVTTAREVVIAVVENHDALMLGLPGAERRWVPERRKVQP